MSTNKGIDHEITSKEYKFIDTKTFGETRDSH